MISPDNGFSLIDTEDEFLMELDDIHRQHLPFWNHALRFVHQRNQSCLSLSNLNKKAKLIYLIFYYKDGEVMGANVFSYNTLVLFCVNEDYSDSFALKVHTYITKNKIIFKEPLEIIGTLCATKSLLYISSQMNQKDVTTKLMKSYIIQASAIKKIWNGRKDTEEYLFGDIKYKVMVKNHYRMFFIRNEQLLTLNQVSSKTNAAGKIRLAVENDYDKLRVLVEEDIGDGESLLDLISNDRVYLYEDSEEIRCCVIIYCHNHEWVDIEDIHMYDEENDRLNARHMICLLSNYFLMKKRYKCLCIKVDIEMPEKSDEFLTSCGFINDCCTAFLTLESSLSKEKKKVNMKKFEIIGYSKEFPETESPFITYQIRVNGTDHIIHKRFQDFFKLWRRLKTNLHCTNIPKCPKNDYFENLNEDFIEKRRNKLEIWLNTIASIPDVDESGWLGKFFINDKKIKGSDSISEDEIERDYETDLSQNVSCTQAPNKVS